MDDDALLVGREVAALDARPEVVGPAEAAALAAAHQAGGHRHRPPVAGAVLLDVGHQDDVLLRRPRTLLHSHLVAARRPTHDRPTHTLLARVLDLWLDLISFSSGRALSQACPLCTYRSQLNGSD